MALLAARAGVGILLAGRRPRLDVKTRLDALVRHDLPLKARVDIRWNDHQVPFIEASDDRDLAVGLGAVHAHLRLVQMEFMRRAARGRLAEVVGPAAGGLDGMLRTLGLARAAPPAVAALPAETHEWLAGFADGINAQIGAMRVQPEEFRVIGMRAEPWSVEDLVAVGRLAATDFSWRVWHRLLRLRRREDWPQIWQRLMREGFVPSFSGAPSGEGGPGASLMAGMGRGGSNSLAVAAGRSATGAALIASDPHLPIALPNLWLIAGMKSPGYHAVGLMIPGVPVVALGRNPWIGWGGTSLHAASSDLIDVTGLPDDAIAERREWIRVRWGKAREITVRETPYGPIVSDVPMLDLPAGRRLALRWIGHRPNDEITAMLRLARARDWDGFMDAIDGFAVPAQNMIYADSEGRVGQAMAAHLPRRPQGAPTDLVVGMDVDAHWRDLATAKDLPSTVDPAAGFVASANDRPDAAPTPVGFFFSPNERVGRLRSVLGIAGSLTVEDLQAMQRDVSMPSSLPLRDALLRAIEPADAADADVRRLYAALRDWDGRHAADSSGALAFEVLIHHFLKALHGEEDFAIYSATWDALTLLGQDLATLPRERLSAAAREAARRAARDTKRHRSWGDIHRLRLSHGLSILPGSGRRYRFADLPVGGGNETVMKTAYGLAAGRHAVRLGANARHVSDLSDPDANHFVLLGGQDGWLGSTTFLDQLPLWRNGAYVSVPMRPESVRRDHRRLTVLSPEGPDEGPQIRPARR